MKSITQFFSLIYIKSLSFIVLFFGFNSFIGFGQTFTNNIGTNLSGPYSPYINSCPNYDASNVESIPISVSGVGHY